MSLFRPEIEPPPPSAAREAWRVRRGAYGQMGLNLLTRLMGCVRALIGMTLCGHHLGAVVVAGWTFRLMRLRTLKGFWLARRVDHGEPFLVFARRHWPNAPSSDTPRLFVSERWRRGLVLPTGDGRRPSVPLRIGRGLTGLVGSLAANLGAGLVATVCTFAVTGIGLLLLLAAWEYGWSSSSHHAHEQASVAPVLGGAGATLFVASMLYVPMAWAHLAATGDPRAFFQGRLIARLVRRRLGALTLYALAFVVMSAPISAMWAFRSILPVFVPGLEDAPPGRVAEVAGRYSQSCGVYLFLAFVASHLLASRIYRSAMLSLLDRDPSAVADLPANLASVMIELGHVPEAGRAPRRPLARIALGMGGWVVRIALWVASALLWASLVVQLHLDQWCVYHEYLVWLNPPLVHLPSLYLAPRGG